MLFMCLIDVSLTLWQTLGIHIYPIRLYISLIPKVCVHHLLLLSI
jgi:hypothetical protein